MGMKERRQRRGKRRGEKVEEEGKRWKRNEEKEKGDMWGV